MALGQNRTTLTIVCDTENIPIYIDGHLLGTTPLEYPVDVLPGWHRVSFFPDTDDTDAHTRELTSDIIRLGTQDVLAEAGENKTVTLSYRSLGQDVEVYYQSIKTGSYLGFSIVFLFLTILIWAYV